MTCEQAYIMERANQKKLDEIERLTSENKNIRAANDMLIGALLLLKSFSEDDEYTKFINSTIADATKLSIPTKP